MTVLAIPMEEKIAKERKLPVVEIFGPTVQGEGVLAGRPSHFLRLGLCDGPGRGPWCSWCDSMHAVDPANRYDWDFLDQREIEERIRALPDWCRRLTITGGNPALHDLRELTMQLWFQKFDIWVETQGTIYRDWLHHCNVTVSPKPPSAGTLDFAKFHKFMAKRKAAPTATAVKVVVDPDCAEDFEFAVATLESYAPWATPCISVVTYPDDDELSLINRWRQVTDWFLSGVLRPETATRTVLLPQLHTLLWLHEKGR